MPLHDKFVRPITDLRISVTDRCTSRCVYCRSADPEKYRPEDELLSWAELERLGQIFLGLGIRKVRVTGGEPLVRNGVEDFIAHLHEMGVEDLSMTTNGHLLAERCDRLVKAGLRRINAQWPLVQIPHERSETARKYRFADGAPGEIGLIAPVSEPFCGFCSRVRLTADGKLRTCLFSKEDHDLKFLLRGGACNEEIAKFIQSVVMEKEA